MTVRITPRGSPQRTDLYGGVTRVWSTGTELILYQSPRDEITLPLADIAELALDEEPGDFF